jgi:hypothetical protein
MDKNLSSEHERPAYVAPSIKTYTESQVAETLGPVLLSGAGTELGELTGGQSPAASKTGSRPRR